eukprot:CAMPEP_0195287420 /NCGR_PEP_ID=MMETSP0707-20130614/4488_1 /TAXON_ID=33640 /ORGANISM="Asterionellopsis glacialis, Strain CCMP134" /LENGTH=479 /DNA_ID=CAMNT_0040347173 /DNA_START=17 /DNA_END=1456 /DNA_ORIENTATION=+
MLSLQQPYTMCRENECQERQSQMQVSEFEATPETQHQKSPKYRILDPRLAVAKYRRSAAGEDFRKRKPRSLEAIGITVHHLLSLLEHQSVFTYNDKDNSRNSRGEHRKVISSTPILKPSPQKKSLATTVAFVDDRIRACQVDIVVGQHTGTVCGEIQLQLVRYHILMLYLMSDLPRKVYEPKFAITALWTSFGAYWGRKDRQPKSDEVHTTLNDDHDGDQIMCLSFLCQIASCLLRDEAALATNFTAIGWNDSPPAGYSSLLQDYSSKIKKGEKFQQQQHLSKWTQFALDIASAAQSGFFHTILSLLSSEQSNIKDAYFLILCRCCMAPALNVVRLGALRQYNKCLGGKQEKVPADEMARLLYLPDAGEAVSFCHSVGLPIVQDGDDWDCPSFIVTKQAPISIAKNFEQQMQSTSRKEDPFVFGPTMYQDMKMTCLKKQQTKDNNHTDFDKDKYLMTRIDEDGVLIPAPQTISNLIRPK